MVVLLAACFVSCGKQNSSKRNEALLLQTMDSISDGFLKGDVEKILEYHHPDVTKALGYTNYVEGRAAVGKGLHDIFMGNKLEFEEHKIESLLFEGETAVELTSFTIKGTPRNGDSAWRFKGRSMVVYIKYEESPTGWAPIREIIQPATE